MRSGGIHIGRIMNKSFDNKGLIIELVILDGTS